MQPTATLPAQWIKTLNRIDHAFQPVVRVTDAGCYGYEALLRGTEAVGFPLIARLFDQAYDDGVLLPVEMALWTRAIAKFAALPHRDGMKLLCNADNRGVLTKPEYRADLIRILDGFGLSASDLCLEISEYQHLDVREIAEMTAIDGIQHALDDFGAEFADHERLNNCPSHIVKIDRFFINGIDRDLRKRVMTKATTALAHHLGRLVIAEGVETEAELRTCRDVGCDFVQGYLIQRPTLDMTALRANYDNVRVALAA
jgi:EAL domain-containing protein (putative c-di-GMP-specific phosphodiesterase class I)